MQPQYAFYFADLLIIFLILAFNVVMFILILQKLTCGRNKDLVRSSDRDKKQSITRAINAIAICAILGLTWVFGFLTIVENRASSLAFQVLFCLFNSLQGLFIFVLFCVRPEEVRSVWKEWLACGKSAKYDGFLSSSHDGHSRGTDKANSRSTGTGNVVASNPPESIQLISTSQNKTSNGQDKTINGQEKTVKTQENMELLPKIEEKAIVASREQTSQLAKSEQLLSKSEDKVANGKDTSRPQNSEQLLPKSEDIDKTAKGREASQPAETSSTIQ